MPASGRKLYGRVDRVPGIFYVATEFVHGNFIPLIPHRGWVVFHETDDAWDGVEFRFSFKSILIAWVRAALIVAFIGSVMLLFFAYTDKHTSVPWRKARLTAIATTAAYIVTRLPIRGLTRASHRRAYEIAKKVELSPYQLELLNAHFPESGDPTSAVHSESKSPQMLK